MPRSVMDAGTRRTPHLALLLLWLFSIWGPGRALAFNDTEVGTIVGNVKTHSEFPGAGGVWMARERTITLDGAGNATLTEHLLARVFDPDWGRSRFSPWGRTYWSAYTVLQVERARIWKSRNEFTDLPRSSEVDTLAVMVHGASPYFMLRTRQLTFPALHTGDVVELRLSWRVRARKDEINTRWLMEPFGAEDPVVEEQVILITPRALKFECKVAGPPVRRYVSDRREGQQFRWITGNLPALRDTLIESVWSRRPAAGDSLDSSVSRLLFSSFPNWAGLSFYYGPVWETAWGQRGPELDRVAARAVSGSSDPAERARTMETYVRTQIRTLPIPEGILDLRPLEAVAIARTGAGCPRDKACLLTSLLRQAGLAALPVLVRTAGSMWDPEFPCPDQLDRFLVQVRLPGQADLWLDPVGERGPLRKSVGLILPTRRDLYQPETEKGLVPFPGLPAAP
jgi:hypothetical protein